MRPRLARQHRDSIGKSAFDFMVGHSLRPLGLRLPRIVGTVPTELHDPAPRTRLPDRLYLLANGEYAHLELQTSRATVADLDRFLEYDERIWHRDHRQVHTVVIYGGRREVRSAPSGIVGGSIHYRVRNVFVNRLDGDSLLGDLEAKVRAGRPLRAGDQLCLALCGLMRHRRQDLLEAARRAAALAGTVGNPRAREVCRGAVFSMAAEVATPEELERLLEVLEMAGATKLQERMEARGKAKGKAEGKAEALLIVLAARCGAPTDALTARIRSERRPLVLEQWLALAARATSIEQFEDGLDVGAGPD